MVIVIPVFRKNVLLESDLRINFIAINQRRKIYALYEGYGARKIASRKLAPKKFPPGSGLGFGLGLGSGAIFRRGQYSRGQFSK